MSDSFAESPTHDAPLSFNELMAVLETLIFVSDEPVTAKTLADVLHEDKEWIVTALESLADEFNARNGGLQVREVAGGWQILFEDFQFNRFAALAQSGL